MENKIEVIYNDGKNDLEEMFEKLRIEIENKVIPESELNFMHETFKDKTFSFVRDGISYDAAITIKQPKFAPKNQYSLFLYTNDKNARYPKRVHSVWGGPKNEFDFFVN